MPRKIKLPTEALEPNRSIKCGTYTVEETAIKLGISTGLVYEGIKTGGIPGFKIGGRCIIPAAAIDKLLAG